MRIEEVEEEPQRKDEKLESALKMLNSYVKARDEGVAPKNPDLEDLLGAMKQQEGCPDINLPKVGTDRSKSETIIPKPFFVVKSTTGGGEKIFINICGSTKIPAPAEWEEGIPPEVEEALKANNENECLLNMPSLRFLVSCSDPVTSTDHGGKPCRVFDIVYNASIVELTITSKKMKVFLIEMATSWISQKYKLELSPDFKLPNMKYKGGEVLCQQIRATPAGPLVSEIPSDSDLDPSFPLLVKKGCKAELPKADQTSSSVPSNPNRDSGAQTSTSETTFHFPEKSTGTSFVKQILRSTLNGMSSPCDNNSIPSKRSPNASVTISLDETAFIGVQAGADRQPYPDFALSTVQPLIDLNYNSRPVAAMTVMISFPQVLFSLHTQCSSFISSKLENFYLIICRKSFHTVLTRLSTNRGELKLEEVEILVTYTQLYVHSKFCESLQVSLPFCTELHSAEGTYDSSRGLVILTLPLLPYSKALTVSYPY